MSKNKIFSLLFCLAVLDVFYSTPVPVGLEANPWHFLRLFAAVILAVILQVMPLRAVCLIAIAIVALSGITTPQSQIRAARIKSLQGIVMSDNTNSQEIAMDKTTEEAILNALPNASKMPKEKFDELLSIKDKNVQIDLLAEFYAKQTSQMQKNKLIDESRIFALNILALQNVS